MTGGRLDGKSVLMIIAHQRFRDEELLHTRDVLLKRGARVKVASTNLVPAKGMLGATVKPDMLVARVDPAAYDAVIFVGGAGAEAYFEDRTALALARAAHRNGKVVAAICIAPSILANAGILEGKLATVWDGPRYVAILKKKGARYTAEPVTVDGKIITANGPGAARKFGEAVAAALSG